MGTRVQVSFSDHVVEACRGDEGTSYVFGPCRGSVSWRTGVVEVCRGHRLRVSWGRGYKVRFRTMSWRCVVEDVCRGGVSWVPP